MVSFLGFQFFLSCDTLFHECETLLYIILYYINFVVSTVYIVYACNFFRVLLLMFFSNLLLPVVFKQRLSYPILSYNIF